jgi:chromosome segregation ATPase
MMCSLHGRQQCPSIWSCWNSWLNRYVETVSFRLLTLTYIVSKLTELDRQKKSAQLDEAGKAVIESQASQLKSYKRSYDKIYEKYRAALSDRQMFEKTMNESEQKLLDAEKKAQRNTEKLEQRIASLEADKARLLGTNESAEGGETPLAANERLLKEAQEKVKVLEKRLVNAREESEYIRDQYRNAQSAAGETGQLRTQLKKAEEEAGRNKVRIHEINVANSVRGYLSRIAELETQLREREVELDRAREELRISKNGRRETRQTSVPRSPRMGMLSPRAPARSYPSSTSRGGSPVPVGMDVGNVAGGSLLPGMQLLPQTPANGRWNQL